MKRTVEYEISLPTKRLSVEVEDADFEGLDKGDIEYEIGEFIQDHFENNVSWYAKNRCEVVSEIMRSKEQCDD